MNEELIEKIICPIGLGVISNIIFAVILYVTKDIWWERLKRSFQEEVGKTILFDTALNNMVKSINNTHFIFIRCGNFNLNHKTYNQEIEKVITHDKIWDYHFHLLSNASKNTEFLKDFFQIRRNKVTSLKPIDTSQIAEIKREEFDRNISSNLKKLKILQSFTDILIQGHIENTQNFPSLNDIDLNKITFSNITFFYPNEASRIEKPYLQEVGNHIIKTLNGLISENICIGENELSPDDSNALYVGQMILDNNK